MEKQEGVRKRRILIVDDEVDTHGFFREFLQADGFEVMCAIGWREAISILAQSTLDLIILDIMMSEINGYVIAETLKQEMDW
ncbi:MAG TPA: response regulator, partial [bacterium]|nr:response regulator [bacterium]